MPALDRVRVVLVGPEFPGNVGAAARALKTMGLSRLDLVAPACDPQADEARWMAHNAGDVLDGVRQFDSLPAALADTRFAIATTQRARRQGFPFYAPEAAAGLLLEHAAQGDVALVFGRESSGLTNDELALCSVLSTIPAATNVPSLNLAQAVMVYAYALFQATAGGETGAYPWCVAPHAEREQFFAHLAAALARSGARPASTMQNYIARFRRVLNRVPLESRDLRLLHTLLTLADEPARRAGGGPIEPAP